jgi:hypothetical protein
MLGAAASRGAGARVGAAAAWPRAPKTPGVWPPKAGGDGASRSLKPLAAQRGAAPGAARGGRGPGGGGAGARPRHARTVAWRGKAMPPRRARGAGPQPPGPAPPLRPQPHRRQEAVLTTSQSGVDGCDGRRRAAGRELGPPPGGCGIRGARPGRGGGACWVGQGLLVRSAARKKSLRGAGRRARGCARAGAAGAAARGGQHEAPAPAAAAAVQNCRRRRAPAAACGGRARRPRAPKFTNPGARPCCCVPGQFDAVFRDGGGRPARPRWPAALAAGLYKGRRRGCARPPALGRASARGARARRGCKGPAGAGPPARARRLTPPRCCAPAAPRRRRWRGPCRRGLRRSRPRRRRARWW